MIRMLSPSNANRTQVIWAEDEIGKCIGELVTPGALNVRRGRVEKGENHNK